MKQYIETRDNLIRDFRQSIDLSNSQYYNGQYNLVSAGLINYLPKLDYDTHEEIFKEILLHKKISLFEQASYKTLNYVTKENLTLEKWDLLKNKPTIICTFHTGSYRAINLFLVRNQIPYSLVIGNSVLEKEGSNLVDLYKQLPGTPNANGFNLINAEQPGAMLRMLKELKAGRSLLLYIDGNTGAGVATNGNENACCIDFLNQKIFARKGVGFLAHASGTPILPIASYRKSWEEICIRFYDPIFPTSSNDRNEFAASTTQHIYSLVAPLIKEYPAQWEAWLYIHKVACLTNEPNGDFIKNDNKEIPEKVTFNSQQFGIFKIDNIPFIISKNTYSFFEIDDGLYDFLMRCKSLAVEKRLVTASRFGDLYQQGVLRCA